MIRINAAHYGAFQVVSISSPFAGKNALRAGREMENDRK
jgi:hypothetical protein